MTVSKSKAQYCFMESHSGSVKDSLHEQGPRHMSGYVQKGMSVYCVVHACDSSQACMQSVEEARNTLFILLGQPRPQDATNRLFETKAPIEVHPRACVSAPTLLWGTATLPPLHSCHLSCVSGVELPSGATSTRVTFLLPVHQ